MRFIAVAFTCFLATTAVADDCGKVVYFDASAPASGVTRVVIAGHAGLVYVKESADAKKIEANGEACSTSDQALAAVHLNATRTGNSVRIEAVSPDGGPAVDFSLQLPNSVAVEVTVPKVEILIHDVASAHVAVGTGLVMIWNVTGSVTIEEHRSGRTVVSDIGGDLVINKTTGVEYERIKGRVISKP